jgi:1,4-alpha-glucan branching enzyme
MITTMNAYDIISVVNSVHKNPHKILGMHLTEVNETKTVPVVRTFFPDAKSVIVVDSKTDEQFEMEKIHQDGLFETIIWSRQEKFPYKFKFQGFLGAEWEMHDAYEDWLEEFTHYDRYLFNRSRHYKIYEKMGAHIRTVNGKKGVFFSCWAPNAERVSVIGNFNNWDGRKDVMEYLSDSGVWVLFKPGLTEGDIYKFEIKGKHGQLVEKSDPYAFSAELRPKTASVVYTLKDYNWTDDEWMKKRREQDNLNRPVSIYEVHLGSWQKVPEEENRFMTYRELADRLIPYTKEMGFTHIEFMPVEEHPFDGSWGYQVTGYYAPTSRYGTPDDLMYFINKAHEENIGVILDWVPAHFPKDIGGLINFDGTALYEHADPKQGEHSDWGTKIFNYGRHEVKNFLISNALYWIDKFHFDGIRVDAVASMLYLDYSKKPGEWVPNSYGGRENLDAIEFIKHLNSIIHQYFPGIMMIAEESSSWPNVSRPTYMGGLGFDFKWNMGWMNDILEYMQKDPIYKKYEHGKLTFGLLYAWTENFILPFSHDEVVHGKGSMIDKMPGDYWQKFANLRLLYSFMWGHPGKQLLFMGQEFAQFKEWQAEHSIDWHLLDFDFHRGVQNCIKDLNELYKNEKAFWEIDFSPEGFRGINCDDVDNSTFSFIRYSRDPEDFLIFALNFTPVPRYNYTIGVPNNCFYKEVFNSDSSKYCGGNIGNFGGKHAEEYGAFGYPNLINITIPPLGAVIFKPIID